MVYGTRFQSAFSRPQTARGWGANAQLLVPRPWAAPLAEFGPTAEPRTPGIRRLHPAGRPDRLCPLSRCRRRAKFHYQARRVHATGHVLFAAKGPLSRRDEKAVVVPLMDRFLHSTLAPPPPPLPHRGGYAHRHFRPASITKPKNRVRRDNNARAANSAGG